MKDKYYESIRSKILDNEIVKKVKDYSKNRSDLDTYLFVGKTLSEAGKHYGEGIIKKYSIKLTKEFGKGYSSRNLWLMLRFYDYYKKLQTVSAVLNWSHYNILLSLDNYDSIRYYINLAENNNLSVRELRSRIKNKEYERLDEETKLKLIKNKGANEVTDYVKNPIIIHNNNHYREISEKVLQQMILEDIPSFLEELGDGFTFIKNEYKIKIGDRYNYIDLLLFNYIYNCFVVIELKITELKKEHIGQIEVYMNYIDKNIKKSTHDKTIGIILVRRNNKYIMEYSSDSRIKVKEYIAI